MNFDRRVTPFRSDLADEKLRGQVEASRFAAGTLKRVVESVASLRRHPSPDAPLDTQALFGEAVTVYDDHEGWSWVQLRDDGYVGYMPSAALGAAIPEPTHRVRALRTFVYDGPNLKLPVREYLSFQSLVNVAGFDGEYARLSTGGFVFAQHLKPIGAAESDLVAVAERFIGVPYLWGGRSSLGLDCSGLAQTALKACGISAPRDSDMQEAQIGNPLEMRTDLGGLQRGDLIFWKGHVGLMLDATRLLHATGFTMDVYAEPLAVAEERIRIGSYGPITAIKRISQ